MSFGDREPAWLFYVGSYAGGGEPGIYLCELHRRTGEMRLLHSTEGIVNPSFLIVDQEALRLYAVSEQAAGLAAAYTVDPASGRLAKLGQEAATMGADPCHLALLPGAEKHLLAANYSSGHVNSFALGKDGALLEMTALIRHEGSGVNKERQESAHAHSIVPSPDGRFAFVSDLGTDQIVIYRLEAGKLAKHGEVGLPPGSGPRHFVLHPSVRFAYGINELNNTMTVYAYDPAEGRLETVQHIGTLPGDFQGENYPADVHLSPDGQYVYGSNRGHDSIVRFRIDPGSGQLSEPAWMGTGGSWPRNFAVLDDYVLVANQYSGNIVAFRRDAESGKLAPAPAGQSLAISKPSCIAPLNAANTAGIVR